MNTLLILKAGTTEPSVNARRGDFEDWFAAGLGWSKTPVEVCECHLGETPPHPAEVAACVITGSSSMLTTREPWSEAAREWVAEAFRLNRLLLGICYGHQLLADATGGSVGWNPQGREIGTVEIELTPAADTDPLLTGLPRRFRAQESHSQSVLELPPGACRLAFNAHDPNQGFAIGDQAWGFQFHPEFDADIVRGYLDSRREAIEGEGLNVDSLRSGLSDDPTPPQILARFGALALERVSAQSAES